MGSPFLFPSFSFSFCVFEVDLIIFGFRLFPLFFFLLLFAAFFYSSFHFIKRIESN